MLVLREGCCALCQESWVDSEALVVITLSYNCDIWKDTTYTNQMHFHPRCWSRATDQSYYVYNETQSLYFTEKEWIELAGKKWNTREYCFVNTCETKYWYSNNCLHREDGPAIEFFDGSKYWYLNGKRHREDGPAYESSSGLKEWHLNDRLHRKDGPAVIRPGSSPDEYWINGRQRFDNE